MLYKEADYILPTGTSINPFTGEGEFGEPDQQTCIVLFKLNDGRTKPTRVVTGFGAGYEDWQIGARWSLRHDQTNAYLGDYEVVGLRHPDGTIEGNVPDAKIKHSVFK